MRLSTFVAATVPEAMAQVRAALGDDAIILATYRNADGTVEVTAATDQPDDDDQILLGAPPVVPALTTGPAKPVAKTPPPPLTEAELRPAAALAERLATTLAWHGVPPRLTDRIALSAAPYAAASPVAALAAGLDAQLAFAGLGVAPPRPLLLIGPPGAGKTTTVAKLAARAVIAKLPTLLISADRQRAGAGEQLDLLGRAMGVRVKQAADAEGLADIVRRESLGRAVFIDGPAANPFDQADMLRLAQFVAAGVEPVLVLPAGGDPAEAAEIALAFAGLGLRRLIATRLDSSRRLGGLLAAGDAANLQFTQAGFTPAVADGLRQFEPTSLARLLLRDPGTGEIASFFDSRASE